MNWLATARGRIGYTITPTWLLYVTGGLAVAGLESSVLFTGLVDNGAVRLVPVSASRQWTAVGFAVGAGGEAAITQKERQCQVGIPFCRSWRGNAADRELPQHSVLSSDRIRAGRRYRSRRARQSQLQVCAAIADAGRAPMSPRPR